MEKEQFPNRKQMREEAERQLNQYRMHRECLETYRKYAPRGRKTQGGILLPLPAPALMELVEWVSAIDAVRQRLEREAPEKAVFLNCFYGLDGNPPKKTARARMIQLSMQMNLAESTLYKWRVELLEEVLLAATQIGRISPYDSPLLRALSGMSDEEKRP